jgi:hypothetical protein
MPRWDVVGSAGGGQVGLGELVVGGGEADLESLGFAGPRTLFGPGVEYPAFDPISTRKSVLFISSSNAEATGSRSWLRHGQTTKLLGVYLTEEKAMRRIASARKLPGFGDAPDGFEVARYVIDRDEWAEGFVTS